MIGFIESLKRHRYYAPQVVYHQPFPPEQARFSRLGKEFPPALTRALEKMGIRNLYSHQAAAIEKVRQGKECGHRHPHRQRQDPDLQPSDRGDSPPGPRCQGPVHLSPEGPGAGPAGRLSGSSSVPSRARFPFGPRSMTETLRVTAAGRSGNPSLRFSFPTRTWSTSACFPSTPSGKRSSATSGLW